MLTAVTPVVKIAFSELGSAAMTYGLAHAADKAVDVILDGFAYQVARHMVALEESRRK